jgi:hypothetical protein
MTTSDRVAQVFPGSGESLNLVLPLLLASAEQTKEKKEVPLVCVRFLFCVFMSSFTLLSI